MKKNIKYLYSICAFGVLFLGYAWFTYKNKIDDTKTQETLIVGVMSGFEPFCRINERGEFEGFDIEIAQRIGKKLNKKIVFKDMNLSALIIALQQNKIDLLLSSVSINDTYKKTMNLVWYQGKPVRAYPLLFWKNIPEGVSQIEDIAKLSNTTIATEDGQKEDFLRTISGISVRAFSTINDIVMDVKYGKSIAIFLDPEIVPCLKKKNPELVSFDVPVPQKFQSEGFGIGINKQNNNLTQEITQIIQELRNEGVIQQLERTWNLVE